PDPRLRPAIRTPALRVATLTERTREAILTERQRRPFQSLADFFLRVRPSREEMEALSRAGAFDGFGHTRCQQFWEIQQLAARWGPDTPAGQGWLIPPPTARTDARAAFSEPTRLQRLQWEMELLGFPASGHPLELYPDVAWETYCPVARLAEFAGQEVTLCGLVIEDRVHHQSTGEPMKFLTLADWTGVVETELFAASYRRHGLATVRHPVLEVTGRVEPFENGRGCTLRVLRAGEPRRRKR
ncbi:MAG: fused DNA polymerase IV/DNA polymerase III subunit alpha, partial [Verrucomicrobia bacterium]